MHYLNNIEPIIQFILDRKNNQSPLPDILITKTPNEFTATVHRKPNHTNRYLNFDSNHPSLYDKAKMQLY